MGDDDNLPTPAGKDRQKQLGRSAQSCAPERSREARNPGARYHQISLPDDLNDTEQSFPIQVLIDKRQHGSIGIAGGGIAGLAAGCALAEAGFEVTVFERRPFVGGRASSYEHPGTGEVVDNCQHVLLGCCTNLLDFYARIGVADKIRWSKRMGFVEPGGGFSELFPSILPAPFHASP